MNRRTIAQNPRGKQPRQAEQRGFRPAVCAGCAIFTKLNLFYGGDLVMMLIRNAQVWTALTLGISLSACGGMGPGSLARVSRGSAQVRQAIAPQPNPTLEEAFEVARTQAARVGGRSVLLVGVSGIGIGPSGRLRAAGTDGPESLWMFDFKLMGQQTAAGGRDFVMVTVASQAAVKVQPYSGEGMVERATIAYRPEACVPFEQAIAKVVASGFQAPYYNVSLAPSDGLFAGGLSAYSGPLTFRVGLESRFDEWRLVSARRGELRRGLSEFELARIKQLVTGVIDRWRLQLTQGAERGVIFDDLVRIGMVPEGARSYLASYDTDRDGQISRSEFIAAFTTDRWLEAWPTMYIEPGFNRADANGDERLTPGEARSLRFDLVDFKGDALRFPLAVTREEFAAADADRDGRLDINEYNPLGTEKTLGVVAADPRAAHAIFLPFTKPWSH